MLELYSLEDALYCLYNNNIHEKFLHADWLRACQLIKHLKFFEYRKTKLVQKVEIECKNSKLN